MNRRRRNDVKPGTGTGRYSRPEGLGRKLDAMIASKPSREHVVAPLVALVMLILCSASRAAQAPPVTHLWPGGLDPRPFITSVTATQEVTLRWLGYGGPYQVEQRPTAASGNWSAAG